MRHRAGAPPVPLGSEDQGFLHPCYNEIKDQGRAPSRRCPASAHRGSPVKAAGFHDTTAAP